MYLYSMNKIMIVPKSEDLFSSRKSKRGAKVYGLPLSKELVSYIDDAAPQANQQRLIDMFFAGKFSPIAINDEDFDDEYEDAVDNLFDGEN